MGVKAVNWNKPEDDYSLMFWKQNQQQFWTEEEISLEGDKITWAEKMSPAEKKAYRRVLGGLTFLDTKQGGEGMPLILLHEPNLQAKAVFAFMGAMEEVHAKSYSYIFTSLDDLETIDETFNWVESNEYLDYKAKRIGGLYYNLFQPTVTPEQRYKAMVASVCLETYLFYSGFFYPLYLKGQGRMTNSGEIIKLIIRDESIHGIFVGLRAQELYNSFSPDVQKKMKMWVQALIQDLMRNEMRYTDEIYGEIGLVEPVNNFLKYNANKALMNLGFEEMYEGVEINPIVKQGLSTETDNHDFFSQKGNGYVKAGKVEKLDDAAFEGFQF